MHSIISIMENAQKKDDRKLKNVNTLHIGIAIMDFFLLYSSVCVCVCVCVCVYTKYPEGNV